MIGRSSSQPATSAASRQVLAVAVAGQPFGIPVLAIREVTGPLRPTRIPLAPPEVAGNLSLRGRIATAIDLRARLGLRSRDGTEGGMNVVIEHQGELYSLIVDSVGEVLSLDGSISEGGLPPSDHRWRDVSAGIHRHDGALLVLLEIASLLNINRAEAA